MKRRRLSARMLWLARWYANGSKPHRRLTVQEARAKFEQGVAEWEARTGRDALGEALASLPPSVRHARRVQRSAREIRAAREQERMKAAG